MKDEEIAKLILKQYLINDLIKIILDYHGTFPPKYIFKELTSSQSTTSNYGMQLMEIDVKPNTTYNIQYSMHGYIQKSVGTVGTSGYVEFFSNISKGSTRRLFSREINVSSISYSNDSNGFIFLPSSKHIGKLYIEYRIFHGALCLDKLEILAIPLD